MGWRNKGEGGESQRGKVKIGIYMSLPGIGGSEGASWYGT